RSGQACRQTASARVFQSGMPRGMETPAPMTRVTPPVCAAEISSRRALRVAEAAVIPLNVSLAKQYTFRTARRCGAGTGVHSGSWVGRRRSTGVHLFLLSDRSQD